MARIQTDVTIALTLPRLRGGLDSAADARWRTGFEKLRPLLMQMRSETIGTFALATLVSCGKRGHPRTRASSMLRSWQLLAGSNYPQSQRKRCISKISKQKRPRPIRGKFQREV